jgi:hypothetical protein
MNPQEQRDLGGEPEKPALYESQFQSSMAAVPIQRKAGTPETATEKETQRPNNTGLPDNLKTGLEQLSGMDMSGVRVHYNSSKPTQLNALAYTQGTEIHVAPRQEQHLPHEAWHVVQQRQGKVKPTIELLGRPINDDHALEKEADVMGKQAVNHSLNAVQRKQGSGSSFTSQNLTSATATLKENKSRSVSNSVTQKKNDVNKGFGFVDNRPKAVAQRKLQEMASNSLQSQKVPQLYRMTNFNSLTSVPIQRVLVGSLKHINESYLKKFTSEFEQLTSFKNRKGVLELLKELPTTLESDQELLREIPNALASLGLVGAKPAPSEKAVAPAKKAVTPPPLVASAPTRREAPEREKVAEKPIGSAPRLPGPMRVPVSAPSEPTPIDRGSTIVASAPTRREAPEREKVAKRPIGRVPESPGPMRPGPVPFGPTPLDRSEPRARDQRETTHSPAVIRQQLASKEALDEAVEALGEKDVGAIEKVPSPLIINYVWVGNSKLNGLAKFNIYSWGAIGCDVNIYAIRLDNTAPSHDALGIAKDDVTKVFDLRQELEDDNSASKESPTGIMSGAREVLSNWAERSQGREVDKKNMEWLFAIGDLAKSYIGATRRGIVLDLKVGPSEHLSDYAKCFHERFVSYSRAGKTGAEVENQSMGTMQVGEELRTLYAEAFASKLERFGGVAKQEMLKKGPQDGDPNTITGWHGQSWMNDTPRAKRQGWKNINTARHLPDRAEAFKQLPNGSEVANTPYQVSEPRGQGHGPFRVFKAAEEQTLQGQSLTTKEDLQRLATEVYENQLRRLPIRRLPKEAQAFIDKAAAVIKEI